MSDPEVMRGVIRISIGLVILAVIVFSLGFTFGGVIGLTKAKFRRFWCSMRKHPYRVEQPAYNPEYPLVFKNPKCSNCGFEFEQARRGSPRI